MTKPAEQEHGHEGTGCFETAYTLFLVFVAWCVLDSLWSPVFLDFNYYERMEARLQMWFMLRHWFLMAALVPAYLVSRCLLFRRMTSLALRPIACVLVAAGVWQAVHVWSLMQHTLPKVEADAASYWESRTEWMLERRARETENQDRAEPPAAVGEPSEP